MSEKVNFVGENGHFYMINVTLAYFRIPNTILMCTRNCHRLKMKMTFRSMQTSASFHFTGDSMKSAGNAKSL